METHLAPSTESHHDQVVQSLQSCFFPPVQSGVDDQKGGSVLASSAQVMWQVPSQHRFDVEVGGVQFDTDR